MRTLYFLALAGMFLLNACSSPKNQFEKGNYEKAVLLSIKKLRKKPSNTKQQAILKAAYAYANQVSEQKIIQFKQQTDRFKWDNVITQYQQMQQLYTELLQCPGCLSVVTAVDYQQQLNEALAQGAEAYVLAGKAALAIEQKEKAREAYRYFRKAKSYQDNYAGIDEAIQKAQSLGTEIVGVSAIPVASKGLELNAAFFQQQLLQLLNQLNYRFASFVSLEALQAEGLYPDQVVDLSFDSYTIGQTFLKETRETVVRDSVHIGEIVDSLGTKTKVYGKVEAELQRFEKTIESGGLLNIAIVQPTTQQVLFQQKLPSTFIWTNDWIRYQGDKRALTERELNLAKNKELLPPPPQELFYAFTQPLFDQTAGILRQRYRYLKK